MVAVAQARRDVAVFRVGAARIDITPSPSELPKNSVGVLDRLYARAIVLDSGTSTAALITIDAGGVPTPLWEAVTRQVGSELKIPVANVLLTATHTHSAGGPRGPDYVQKIVESVRMASQRLTPARLGYGTGVSYINVNRQIVDPKTGRWWEGPNYDGPSDKTVAVLKFETVAGEPIAVYYNYACTRCSRAARSGERRHSGAASRYVEESFDDRIVAAWSSGAAGDQNPIYYQQTYALREIRIKDYATRGLDISNAMPPGGEGLDRKNPTVARLMNQQRQMVSSMGQFLGEEVLHVMRGIERYGCRVPVHGSFHDCQLSRTRANQSGPGRFRGDVYGWTAGRDPARTAARGGRR
jgi:hypothetical protein